MTNLHIKQYQYIYRFLATLDGPIMKTLDLPENPSTGLQIKLNGGLFYRYLGQMNTSTPLTNSINSATILGKLHKDRL